MVREAELGVMDGDETLCTKFGHGFSQLLGHGVYWAPVGIVLAILHAGEVDIGKLFSKALETTAVATIAREKGLSR